jgi:YbbR domain-containing protein
LDLQLAQNFMLDGALRVSPSEIQVVGPAEEIDSLRFLSTQPLVLQQVDADFDLDLPLSLDIKLEKSKLSTAQVRVSGTVFRFTEALVTVPVVVSNLPERLQIKTFPPEVQVLCSGRVEAVKNLGPNDFSVVADFRNPDPLTGRLKLELKAFPARIHSAVLRETSVEFIIRRQ